MKLSREERKKVLLEAARDLFVEKGYHHTTTRDIARAAGVSEPMIYKHFSGKHELFFEVIYMIASELLEELMIDEKLEPEVFVEKFFYYHMETVSRHFDSLRLLLSQLLFDPGVKETYIKIFLPKMKEKMFPLIKNMGITGKESAEYTLLLLGGLLLVFELAEGLFDYRPEGISREELSRKLARNYMVMIKGGTQ